MSKQFDYTDRPALRKQAFWCRKPLVSAVTLALATTAIPATSLAGTIKGCVFMDWNENGIKDAWESALADSRTLNLTLPNLGGISQTMTDASGCYSFSTVLTGTYTIRINKDLDWIQTIPLVEIQEVPLYDFVVNGVNDTVTIDFGLVDPVAKSSNSAPTITASSSSVNATINQNISLTVDFTDTNASDHHIVKWDFGDGSTVVSETLAVGIYSASTSHTYTSMGSYTATLTITDSLGAKVTKAFNISVESPPVVTIGGDVALDVGESFNFNGSFTDPDGRARYDYVWKFGDGNIKAGTKWSEGTVNANHAFKEPGEYTVTLEVNDRNGNKGFKTLIVNVRGDDTDPCATGVATVKTTKTWGMWDNINTWDIGKVPTSTDWILIKSGHKVVIPTSVSSPETRLRVKGICIEQNGVLQSYFNSLTLPSSWIHLSVTNIHNQGTIRGEGGINASSLNGTYRSATGGSNIKLYAYKVTNDTTGIIGGQSSGQGGHSLPYLYLTNGTTENSQGGAGGLVEVNSSIVINTGRIQGGKGGNAFNNQNGRENLDSDDPLITQTSTEIFGTSTGGRGGAVTLFPMRINDSSSTGPVAGGCGGSAYSRSDFARSAGLGGSVTANTGFLGGQSQVCNGSRAHWNAPTPPVSQPVNSCRPIWWWRLGWVNSCWWNTAVWWRSLRTMFRHEPLELKYDSTTRIEGYDDVVIFGGEEATIDLQELSENAIIAKTITIAVGEGGTVDLRGVNSKVFNAVEKLEIFVDEDKLLLDNGVTLADLTDAPEINVGPAKILYHAEFSTAEHLVGEPNTTVPVKIALRNGGPTEDTYTLAVTDSAGWNLSGLPETVTVNSMRSSELELELVLPANRGVEDLITITATSQNDPEMQVVAEVRVGVIEEEIITPRTDADPKADLTLVVDDSAAMGGEIIAVSNAIESFLVEHRDAQPTIEVITFKDEVTSRIVTTDVGEVIGRIRSLRPSGGGDCPNASVAALTKALPYLNNSGQIILATAASPHQDPAQVIAQAQQQGVKVNVLLAGSCANEASDKALYQNLAVETGGTFNWLPRGETSAEVLKEVVTNVVESAITVNVNGGLDFTLTGQLLDKRGTPVIDATIQIGEQTATTDADGNWEITGLIEGNYDIVATKDGFVFLPENIELTANSADKQEITLSIDKEPFDVWVLDPAPDDGSEPGKATRIWASPDVWVRNQDDGGTRYQNVIFGQDNYVYVNVRNRGTLNIQNTTVEVYRSGASLGQGWPRGWELVGTAEVASLESQASETVRIKWDKEKIAKPGHYCFYVRLLNDDDPMFALETNNMVQNTKTNNNIAWRNFNVVGLLTKVTDKFEVAVGNPTDTPVVIDLLFDEPENLLQNDGARAIVDLGAELFQRWQDAGGQGENIQVLNGTEIQLLATPAKLIGIALDVGEDLPITMRVDAFEPAPGAGTSREYQFSTQEFIDGELVGGVEYAITTRAQDTDSDGDGIRDVEDDDNDNDGIPDTWEIEHGLNPLGEADASEDIDGDGQSNLEEFEGGTDPSTPPIISPDASVYVVKGIVQGVDNQSMAGVTVQIADRTVVTNTDGTWEIDSLLSGKYTATFSKAGYSSYTKDIVVSINEAQDSSYVSIDKITLRSLLEISVLTSPSRPLQGADLTYTITVTNKGETTATGLTLTEILPDSVTLLVMESESGGACDENTLNCILPDLAAGASATITIRVKTTEAVRLVNTITVSSNEYPEDVVTRQTTVLPYLSVSLSDNPDPVPLNLVQGESLRYTATIKLDEQAIETASGVHLKLNLPTGLQLQGISTDNGICDTTQLPKVLCDLTNLEVGSSVSVTIDTQLQDLGLLTFTAIAEVSADNYPTHKDRERTNIQIPAGVEVDMALVIDDTGSMQQEIDSAKEALKQFIANIDPSQSPLIAFITFKDEATVRFFGRDLNILLKEIDNLKASGGGTCPEASVEALNAAVPHVKQGGNILFVTDASPYDDADVEGLAGLLRSKAIRLTSIVTGDCSNTNSWNNLEDSQ